MLFAGNERDIPLYREALQLWGRDRVIQVLVEEVVELIEAHSRAMREYSEVNLGAKFEEMADVIVVSQQFIGLCGDEMRARVIDEVNAADQRRTEWDRERGIRRLVPRVQSTLVEMLCRVAHAGTRALRGKGGEDDILAALYRLDDWFEAFEATAPREHLTAVMRLVFEKFERLRRRVETNNERAA